MLKILIVDDNQGWRNFNKSSIEAIFGDEAEITLAESARDGYDKVMFAGKEKFDLIISDLQMESDFAPVIAGEWFVRQVLTFPRYKTSEILLVSAMYNIEMISDMLGVDCLSKRLLISGSELPLQLKLEEMGYKIPQNGKG